MKLPAILERTLHKSGGKITRVTSFTHVEDKPQDGCSRDYWHFIGDVQWRDGSKSEGIEIAPYMLCADAGAEEPEISCLMNLMNAYLAAHGQWCDRKSKHEGWYANRPAKRRAA